MKLRSRSLPVLIVLVLIVLASLALVAAGCGSTATTAGPETTTTTAPETTTSVESTATTVAGSSTTGAAPAAVSGTITVKGLVDNPETLTVDVLQGMNPVTITAEHPKQGEQQYTGVRFSDLIAALEVQSGASNVIMGATDGYMAEVPLTDIAASPDSMIAIGDDGTLNAVMPGMFGKAWVRDIITMEFK